MFQHSQLYKLFCMISVVVFCLGGCCNVKEDETSNEEKNLYKNIYFELRLIRPAKEGESIRVHVDVILNKNGGLEQKFLVRVKVGERIKLFMKDASNEYIFYDTKHTFMKIGQKNVKIGTYPALSLDTETGRYIMTLKPEYAMSDCVYIRNDVTMEVLEIVYKP